MSVTAVPASPAWALRLFRQGFDTVSIARFMGVSEAEAHRLLIRARGQ